MFTANRILAMKKKRVTMGNAISGCSQRSHDKTASTMTQVRAAHLLIKHTGSRNPVSRRTGQQVSLTPEEAHQELEHYQQLIVGEGVRESFPKYAMERSDCSSFRQKGDLGFFGPGQMQKPFEEASFALHPGEMSGIVSTDSGVHLIYRIA
jgi:parvulin-like peptidyl-prolyl isomerase